jgi:hypothetical protein
VQKELCLWQRQGLLARVWVRDDDATEVTEALRKLERIARRFSIQIGLAVIPAKVKQALVIHLQTRSEMFYPMCHGYMHTNHSTKGTPAEFGDDRPLAEIVEEVRLASAAFSAHFQQTPVFVPPFNCISRSLERKITQLGFKGLSRSPRMPQRQLTKINSRIAHLPSLPRHLAFATQNVDVHIDIIDWETHSAKSPNEVASALLGELRMRRKGYLAHHTPIGILTHHLVHDDQIWQSIEDLLENLAAEPAVRLCAAADIIDNVPQHLEPYRD